MGAKKKIESAADFQVKISEFIRYCEENDTAPTDYLLWNFLGLKPSQFDAWAKYKMPDGKPFGSEIANEEKRKKVVEEDKRRVDDAIKSLTAFREDRLVRQLEASRNANTNAIFQLKQAKNGGYQDVQGNDTNASVTIKIDGIGGLEAFK